MQIPELKAFFNYQPILLPDPQHVVDQIKQLASAYLGLPELEAIQATYEFARTAHAGQLRESGEYYISHIVQATRFLMLIKPDLETIKGCLLHDVIEDCDISPEDIEKHFGATVRKLCEGVTKVSKLKYRGEERQIETLKKTFFAMSDDLRVIFIKLADRIHNIQTLHFHPKPDKQARIANETLEIYVPIAERLGLYQFQYLLENGCFRLLHPAECNQIINYLDKPVFYKSADKGAIVLTKLLEEDGLTDFTIKGRLKSPYRVYKKMAEKYATSDLGQIYDLIAFRIILDSVPNCYLAMGIIHNKYTPLVHKIKDYIVVPKPNGYQSIHSIILGLFSFPVEIQIRTREMDKYAEYGVAAHFAYKEGGYAKAGKTQVDIRQTQWVTKLQDIVKSYQDDNDAFKQEMKIELLDDNIFLYTPKGEIIEMKNGSTVLDFAFRIHSEVGLRFKNALINGSIVPIDFQPKTGDVIQINTRKNQYSATTTWLEILKTAGARNQLNKYLKSQMRDELLKKSIDNLNTKLAEYKLPLFKSEGCLIWKEMENKQDELEGRLLEMLDKAGYGSFINIFYKDHGKTNKSKKQDHNASGTNAAPQIIIDGQYNFQYILCPECSKLDTQIIAKSGKEGIKIHHIGCKAMSTVGYEKLIAAQYDNDPKPMYYFSLKLQITNESGNLNKVLQILSKYNTNIQHIAFLDTKSDSSLGHITLELANPSKISFILKELAKFPSIVSIKEKKFI